MLKFNNFVTVVARVSIAKIGMTPFEWPTPKTPVWCKILHVSLTVSQLWLFKFAIGRNANFQILGAKGGKFQFFLTKPYKECECHQNASFKPLTTIIGPTGGPVAMRMKHLAQESPAVADKHAPKNCSNSTCLQRCR